MMDRTAACRLCPKDHSTCHIVGSSAIVYTMSSQSLLVTIVASLYRTKENLLFVVLVVSSTKLREKMLGLLENEQYEHRW
jgi:hypothetical protein